ncbi:hypothetical protein HOY80DRAFT_1139271 [Tuber brumale]|nr:hypothetical protein HOY80DRAFT_1139271 [Tuber brumale]
MVANKHSVLKTEDQVLVYDPGPGPPHVEIPASLQSDVSALAAFSPFWFIRVLSGVLPEGAKDNFFLPSLRSGSSGSCPAYSQRMLSPISHSDLPALNLPFLARVRVWPRVFIYAVSPHARRIVRKEISQWQFQVVFEVSDQPLNKHAEGAECVSVAGPGSLARKYEGQGVLRIFWIRVVESSVERQTCGEQPKNLKAFCPTQHTAVFLATIFPTITTTTILTALVLCLHRWVYCERLKDDFGYVQEEVNKYSKGK